MSDVEQVTPATDAPAGAAPSPRPVSGERLGERRLWRFVAAVVAAGGCVVAAALPGLSPEAALRLAPLLFLVVVAERLTNLDFGRSAISVASVVSMAAALTGGPAAGAVVGLANGLASLRWRSLSPLKSPFNVAAIALSAAVAGLPSWLAQHWSGHGELVVSWFWLSLGVASGLLFFAVNYSLLAMVLALASGTTWQSEWRLRFNWLVLHYAAMGGIAAGLVMLHQVHGLLGLVLLLGPAGMLYYAQRQYVTHTGAYVGALSALNQELTASNERLGATLTELRSANEAMLAAFSEALELRDRETEGHCRRVVHYSRAIATSLGLSHEAIETVVHGALLHDIGKIGVPDAILHKPGKLTNEEWVEMKRHAEIGYRMVGDIPFLAQASLLVRHHHERWDSHGYPAGLAGEAIPLGARIFAVADSFDAMTSDRPYRAALSWEAALAELAACSGTQFDPRIVAAFIGLVTTGALRPWDVAVEPAPLETLGHIVRAVDGVDGWATARMLAASQSSRD
jgi:hypothetical protein